MKVTTDTSKEYEYNVSTPGDLINMIEPNDVDAIINLKLIGKLNGTDFLVLNRMVNIRSLDLSEATIVSGGMPYYDKDNERFGTEDNTLGQNWAYNLNLLATLNLPNNLVMIGSYALNNKVSLNRIFIPKSVISIGSSAFSGCSGLTEVTIPNSVTSIGSSAFSGCTNIENLTIDCENIGSWFNNKSSIKTLNIGNNVKSIGEYAFRACIGLTEIKIPNSVTSIGNSAFSGCIGLTEIKIPNSVTSIGNSAFSGCSGLTEVTIPNYITSIGDSAFSGCSGLTEVTIPNSVTEIGSSAFSGCSGLTEVTIPNSVTSISNHAFFGCSGLTEIKIPNSVTSIGNSAFSGCSGLTEVTIPNFVTEIGNYAFYCCSGLTEVTIPNSVTSIGYSAFDDCSSLKDLTFEDGEETLYLGYNDYSYSYGMGMFYSCPLETLYLGRNLSYETGSRYGYSPFYNMTQLQSLTFGNNVSKIEGYTFRGCSSLTYVSIPEPVTQLYKSTFYGCASLKEIVLPGSMREIAADAFSGCTSLERVTVINPIPPVIESSTFEGCPATAVLYIPEGSRNIYWIHPYWGKFKTINNLNLSEEFNIENLAFRITSEQDATVEISGASLAAKSSRSAVGELEIPSEVSFNGKTYRVAGIANKGFADLPIGSVYLPATISYVGLEAFKNNGLTAVTCMAALPPSANANSFDDDTYQNAKLTVPEIAADLYKAHEVWQKFGNTAYAVMVQSLTLDPEVYEAEANTQFQITATVLPENATDKTLEWSSSDESVATVDQTGLVTILKEGECVITARTTDGSALQAECRLSVRTEVDMVTSGVDGQETRVFNLNGVMISDSTENLAPGIYIVVRGTKTRKIIVK